MIFQCFKCKKDFHPDESYLFIDKEGNQYLNDLLQGEADLFCSSCLEELNNKVQESAREFLDED